MSEAVRSTIQLADDKGVVRHGGEWLLIWSDPDSLKTEAELGAAHRAMARRAEHERLIAAALRGIARLPELRVRLAGEAVVVDGQACTLPALPLEPGPVDFDVARGRADAVALMLRHHDPAMHTRLSPRGARARALFDVIEQARCEALGARELPGVLHNLTAALADRLARGGFLQAALAAQIPAPEAFRMIVRDALLGCQVPSLATAGLEMWHRFARARFGAELENLRQHLSDQVAFAEASHALIRALYRVMEWDPDRPDRASPIGATALPTGASGDEGSVHRLGPALTPAHTADGLVDGDQEENVERADDPTGVTLPRPMTSAGPAAVSAEPYHAFTHSHDRVMPAEELTGAAELARLRHELDAALGDVRALLARLANRLQRRLLAQQLRAWDFDLDEGILDAARLDRVVVNPGTALSFKQERESPFCDTVVSLLIDNSGSMRGRPITLAAMTADIVARALDRCGVRTEVLGFTTVRWKGGASSRDWAAAGRPKSPGRLNDLLHIVYKAADIPYRRARMGLALMLKDGLLKENIDGEALAWAEGRLLARPEGRRILLAISDGAPVDQATLEANDPLYLDRHLRRVIENVERDGRVELGAIGIGHDVTRYYRRAKRIDSADALGPALIGALEDLLQPPSDRTGCRRRRAEPHAIRFA
jgi:cobaltochelatase CobT